MMMSNHIFRYSCCICLLLTSLCHAQERAKSTQRSFSVHTDMNPFRDSPTIASQIAFIDLASPSLGWFTKLGVEKNNSELTTFQKRDSILRILGLTQEESALLDQMFHDRIEAHAMNLEKLNGPQMRERDLEFAKKGAPQFLTKYASTPEVKKGEIDAFLIEYSKNERIAEKELTEKLEELLPPRRFVVLVHEWWHGKLLYIPIVSKYLDLSDDQVSRIEAASVEAWRLEWKIKESYRGADPDEIKKLFTSNIEYNEAVYRPFSFLTPIQFRTASKGLLKSWHSTSSFSERLELLSEDASIRAQAELKILGDLYREGIKLEQKQK